MSAANPSYKPSEGKREEFRKYLEKNGVMDALTRVLVNLYEETEKPEDALEYIRDKLAIIAGLETNKELLIKLSEVEDKVIDLEAQLAGGKTGEGEPEGGSISPLAEEAPAKGQPEKTEENEPAPCLKLPSLEENPENASVQSQK
ncbi:c-Myc-binding protein homolog [Euwallacea fornicatus]|uniref:c-Myc-binding protein homolog n=1 Tax=Euwallacea fornicatus TaxID=995702 RepID=UPI00338E99CB